MPLRLLFVFPLSCLHAGGYDFPGTARCWTHITSLVVGETLDNDIPEHEVTGVLCACGLCVCVCVSLFSRPLSQFVWSQKYVQA